jgi:hypothetical protein
MAHVTTPSSRQFQQAPTRDAPPMKLGDADGGVPRIPPPKRHRQRGLIFLGVALVVFAALAAVFVVNQVSDRIGVVGVRVSVAYGQVVQQSDLVEVQLPADAGLKPVLWHDVQSLLGKRAATDLRVGALVTADSVSDQDIPPAGKVLLGIPVKATQMPGTPLKVRDQVLLVPFAGGPTGQQTPGDASTAGSAVAAEVFATRATDVNGVSVVDVLVPEGRGVDVAQRAAAGQIALVLTPRR